MNKTRVIVNKNLLMIDGDIKDGDGYFIQIYQYNIQYNKRFNLLIMDEEICSFLDIDTEYYYETMIKFKAIFVGDQLYFRKIRHAKKALVWMEKNLESLLIMKKVVGH
jgi:CCR4-NOT transcriptional regulation complex NOT5 subunit